MVSSFSFLNSSSSFFFSDSELAAADKTLLKNPPPFSDLKFSTLFGVDGFWLICCKLSAIEFVSLRLELLLFVWGSASSLVVNGPAGKDFATGDIDMVYCEYNADELLAGITVGTGASKNVGLAGELEGVLSSTESEILGNVKALEDLFTISIGGSSSICLGCSVIYTLSSSKSSAFRSTSFSFSSVTSVFSNPVVWLTGNSSGEGWGIISLGSSNKSIIQLLPIISHHYLYYLGKQ
ncbi:hypothetical protein WICMUC_004165 [Wickerhamomyces mucosus]|uniref:Uncharacterized protein n=1 Tax=Wickerhamomyces mucosus TaxID=1378264 RepID=A0A9P8PJX0_9ASCO|nr:hypothetical protein WICMUC_004165 [Wickerhamomyces mucosus]